jgi:hypothetical protein
MTVGRNFLVMHPILPAAPLAVVSKTAYPLSSFSASKTTMSWSCDDDSVGSNSPLSFFFFSIKYNIINE